MRIIPKERQTVKYEDDLFFTGPDETQEHLRLDKHVKDGNILGKTILK